MPTIQAVGTINGIGICCAISQRAITVVYRYREGSILYSIPKAKKGIFEKIAVKTVRLIPNRFSQIIHLYVDTLNGLWNEDELCTEEEAKSFVVTYLERQHDLLLDALC